MAAPLVAAVVDLAAGLYFGNVVVVLGPTDGLVVAGLIPEACELVTRPAELVCDVGPCIFEDVLVLVTAERPGRFDFGLVGKAVFGTRCAC